MRTQMNGYIVADEDADIYRLFGYQVIAPADLRQALADNPPGEVLTVEINSPGGSMFAGYEMYSVLRAAQCSTEAEVQSLAASAASTAMLGADRVLASPVAQVMIHLPSVTGGGDAGDHRSMAEALEKFKVSILNAYELKCGGKKSRQELAAMMEAETWLPVQEAMGAGLVDGVLYDEAGVLAAQVVNCVGAGLRSLAASGGLPGAADLRARHAAQSVPKHTVPQPAEPEHDTAEAARLRAELDLLKLI